MNHDQYTVNKINIITGQWKTVTTKSEWMNGYLMSDNNKKNYFVFVDDLVWFFFLFNKFKDKIKNVEVIFEVDNNRNKQQEEIQHNFPKINELILNFLYHLQYSVHHKYNTNEKNLEFS